MQLPLCGLVLKHLPSKLSHHTTAPTFAPRRTHTHSLTHSLTQTFGPDPFPLLLPFTPLLPARPLLAGPSERLSDKFLCALRSDLTLLDAGSVLCRTCQAAARLASPPLPLGCP